MKRLLMTLDRKKVNVDTEKDEVLYEDPRTTAAGRCFGGTDLLCHTSKQGNTYYYLHGWSVWADEEGRFELLTKGEARDFILQEAVHSEAHRRGIREEKLDAFGEDLFEEDA